MTDFSAVSSSTAATSGLTDPPIQLGGLSSGLDTNSVIQALMATEQDSRNRLGWQQTAQQTRQSDLNDIKTKLQTLQTDIQALQSPTTWAPTQQVTSADETKVTAQLTGGAAPGGYTIAINNLATAAQRTYTYTAPTADTTFTINGQSVTLTAGSTADAAAATINSTAGTGVVAVNVNGSLVLASTSTGSTSAVSVVDSSGSFVEQSTQYRAGTDASFSVNGVPQTSHSNTVKAGDAGTTADFPIGVTLTLKGATTGTGIDVTAPAIDPAAVTTAITTFVNDYNTAMSTIRTYTTQAPVANPQNAQDQSQGVLYGDTGLESLMDQLRGAIGQEFTGVGNSTSMDLLSEIGISTGATTGGGAYSQDSVDGKLVIDTTALQNALTSDPQSVERLLGGIPGSTSGLVPALSAQLDPFVQAGGLLDTEIQSAQSEASDIGTQMADWDQRLSDEENNLRTQFTNMETALNSLKSQGSSMESQLGLTTTSSSTG